MGLRVLSVTWLLVLALTGCASLRPAIEPPTVVLDSLQLLPSEGLSQRFNIGLTMTNPNDRPLKIKGIAYTLGLNGYRLLEGVGNDIPEVAAFSEVHFDVQASTNLFEALRLADAFISGPDSGDLDYRFEARIAVVGLPRRLTIEQTGQVPGFSEAD